MTFNTEGYEIIEIEDLDSLQTKENIVFLLYLLTFTIESVEKEFKEYDDRVKFELIKVSYLGDYPAIGIKYLKETKVEFDTVFNLKFKTLIKESTVQDFCDFVVSNQERIISWKKENGL